MMRLSKFLALALVFASVSCASSTGIFPQVDLSLTEADLTLPNPVDIVADTANGQIIVINSNVDFYFDQGSLYTIDVDASNPNAVQLTATDALAIPNFAGEAAVSGATLFIPFRESVSEDDDDTDLIASYTFGAASLAEGSEGEVGKDPFGIALNAGNLFVVNDSEISILDTALNAVADIDLTTADDAGILDAEGKHAESVAVDAANDRLYVSNRSGKVFVVDMSDREITHVIDGPLNTRGIAIDGNRIYVVDGDSPALWVWDASLLPAASAEPDEVDDSQITLGLVDLGLNPNGIAVDSALNRVYVANSAENSVSIIDTVLLQEIARISFDEDDTGFEEDGKEPFSIALGTYDGVPLVFVGNFASNSIFVINAQTLDIVENFPDQ